MIRSVVLLLALPFALHAQSQADLSSPAAFSTTGAFFALSVADLDGTTRWYSEKLGLRVVRQTVKVQHPSVVILASGGLIVELVHNDGAPSRRADGAPGSGDDPRMLEISVVQPRHRFQHRLRIRPSIHRIIFPDATVPKNDHALGELRDVVLVCDEYDR